MKALEKIDFYVKRDDITVINFDTYEIFWAVGLLYEYNKEFMARANDEVLPYIYVSPELIYANLYDTTKITRRVKENMMKAFHSLIDKGMIVPIDSSKPTWGKAVRIDVRPLLANNDSSVRVSTDDVGAMITRKPSEFSMLLLVYLNITSYINQGHILYLEENGFDKNTDLVGTYKDNEWHISCYASLERLSTTKHSTDKNKQAWITRPTLIKYIDVLVELGLLQVVKHDIDGCGKLTNHYCYPRYANYVKSIANRQAEQFMYSQQNKLTNSNE